MVGQAPAGPLPALLLLGTPHRKLMKCTLRGAWHANKQAEQAPFPHTPVVGGQVQRIEAAAPSGIRRRVQHHVPQAARLVKVLVLREGGGVRRRGGGKGLKQRRWGGVRVCMRAYECVRTRADAGLGK